MNASSGLAALLVVAAVVVATAGTARADAGEVSVGGRVVGEAPTGVGGDLGVELGLADNLAARLFTGGRYLNSGVAGLQATAGLTYAWDVLAWVPELSLSGGVTVDLDSDAAVRGVGLAGIGVRHYFGIDWSASATLGAGVRGSDWFGWLAVGLWYGPL